MDRSLSGSAVGVSGRVRVPHRVAPDGGQVRSEHRRGQRRHTHTEYAWLYGGMAITDGLSLSLALFLASMTEAGHLPDVRWLLLVLPLVGWMAFSWLRLYQSHLLAPADEFRRVLIGVTLANVTVVTFSFWANVPYSRAWVASTLALSLVFTLATRRFWRWAVFRERKRRGRYTFRTAIVGTNGEAVQLAHVLQGTTMGFQPVGFVATDDASPSADCTPVIGSIRSLPASIACHAIESVFVAATGVQREDIAAVQRTARRAGIDVHVTANLPELLASRIAVEPLGGITALSLKPVRLSGTQAAAKRAFDLVFGSVALLLTLPIWIVAAALVKLTSPGPVLFQQERVGRHGEPITLLKFRTMCMDAEARLGELLQRNEADGPLFKMRNDPRVTRVGKLLRRTSVDELPQLVNVLRGEMSLVGPRPPLQSEVDAYEDWQRDRLEVRPGITGVWQVSGRSDVSFSEYIRLDLFYIENWSLAFDVYLIAKTIPAVLRARGAR